jgi:hypothetical protein
VAYCRKCGIEIISFCHDYMCEECCKATTISKIIRLQNMHKEIHYE